MIKLNDNPSSNLIDSCDQQQQDDDIIQNRTTSEIGSNDTETNNTSHHTIKIQKYHHITICMVPPSSSKDVWDNIIKAREQLQDPGFYRWPPHVNLLYPFIDVHITKKKEETSRKNDKNDDEEMDDDDDVDDNNSPIIIDPDIINRLIMACQKCEPFHCRLNEFGTFGGQKRGVLWLEPSTSYYRNNNSLDEKNNDNDNGTSSLTTTILPPPLIHLQQLLEEQFPLCDDQRKVGGVFTPHMTLSHFQNMNDALIGQEQIQDWWPNNIDFPVNEIYLLKRVGDNGQFHRIADIRLGDDRSRSIGYENDVVLYEHNAKPFEYMPQSEPSWTYTERMKLKKRRNRRR